MQPNLLICRIVTHAKKALFEIIEYNEYFHCLILNL